MNFIQKISPLYVPPQTAQKGGLYLLRERILQSILLICVAFGIPAVVAASRSAILRQDRILPVIYATVFVIFLLITITRRLNIALRGRVMIVFIYLMALSELFESGQLGEVRMFLLAFIALTAVLFKYTDVIITIVISLLTIIIAGVYAAITPNPVIPALARINQGTDWITSAVVFLMISQVIAGSISMIINGLDNNLKKQAELTRNLENERDTLEDRIQERTSSMAHRMVQLRTAAEISRTISALSEPETLLQDVVDLIRERFDLYYAGIFLIDSTHSNAVLQAGTGEPGKQMRSQGHQLAVGGSSMIGWSITNRKSRVALDVGMEAVRFNNPNLPLTRSELALPIIAHDNVLGAMTIQSERPNAFDENDIAILESITDSLAIALENDSLYHETRRSLEEIRALNREYLQRAWAETVETYGSLSYDYEEPTAGGVHWPTNTIQVPLLLRDEIIGTISLEMERPTLTEDETSFIDNVTTQTAIALENARLLHETERRAVQEQKLNELATRFSRALSIEEILRAAAQELGQLPTVAEVSVQLNPAMPSSKITNLSSLSGTNGKERKS